MAAILYALNTLVRNLIHCGYRRWPGLLGLTGLLTLLSLPAQAVEPPPLSFPLFDASPPTIHHFPSLRSPFETQNSKSNNPPDDSTYQWHTFLGGSDYDQGLALSLDSNGDIYLVGGGAVTHTFTIANTGSAPLDLTGSPAVQLSGQTAGDFTVAAQPDSNPVAAHSAAAFQVRFAPSLIGTRVATVTIANNDSDENPYTFAIQGVGTTNVLYLPLALK